ncbi:hypothetical protein BU16DRAFT_543656 [Lophium mytilinum]|uniref:Uncharacterized protein n=1 Tax=Lophium mytilinum TaxID=390894 RepID=A0A6A6QDY5_9PEZI|nr:hypothetical protein BU16DRAFT_543656 [Lophium mytilinum]
MEMPRRQPCPMCQTGHYILPEDENEKLLLAFSKETSDTEVKEDISNLLEDRCAAQACANKTLLRENQTLAQEVFALAQGRVALERKVTEKQGTVKAQVDEASASTRKGVVLEAKIKAPQSVIEPQPKGLKRKGAAKDATKPQKKTKKEKVPFLRLGLRPEGSQGPGEQSEASQPEEQLRTEMAEMEQRRQQLLPNIKRTEAEKLTLSDYPGYLGLPPSHRGSSIMEDSDHSLPTMTPSASKLSSRDISPHSIIPISPPRELDAVLLCADPFMTSPDMGVEYGNGEGISERP